MKQNLSNQINLLEAKTHFSNLIQRVYSFYLKNWLSRLCSPFGTHVLLYTPFLSLQTPSSFSNKTSSINFSFTRNIKGREQITICKHNTLVAVLSPITKKPKIKTEDIVEQIMEFNKDKTLALYTIKELRDESRR